MQDGAQVFLIVLMLIVIGALGISLGRDSENRRAVRLGVAEYYLDKDANKQFHYYVEPKEGHEKAA